MTCHIFIVMIAVIFVLYLASYVWFSTFGKKYKEQKEREFQDNIEKERQAKCEQFEQVANQFGFAFNENPDSELIQLLKDFDLFKFTGLKLKYLLEGRSGGFGWKIFEYERDRSTKNKIRSEERTIFCILVEDFSFPSFSLMSRDFESQFQFKNIFGIDNIKISEIPKLSVKYILQGKDEQKIKKLFTSKVIKYILELKETENLDYIQAKDNILIAYPGSFNDILSLHSKVEPEDIPEKLKQYAQLIRLFKESFRTS